MADSLNYLLFNNPVCQKIISTSKVNRFYLKRLEISSDSVLSEHPVQEWKFRYDVHSYKGVTNSRSTNHFVVVSAGWEVFKYFHPVGWIFR